MADWNYMGNGICERDTDKLTLTKVKSIDMTVQLNVEVFCGTVNNGDLLCSFLNLDVDLKKIAEHGIYFDTSDKYKIKSIIKQNYSTIPTTNSSAVDEVAKLYEMFCTIIKDCIDEEEQTTVIVKDSLYCIPLDKFDEEVKGSISKMSAKDLRIQFSQRGYTESNPMRTDKMIKDKDNKPVRVVAFIKSSVDGVIKK